MYTSPMIHADSGIVRKLKEIKGRTLVTTMELPWGLLKQRLEWEPDHIHMITDMDLTTLERLDAALPQFDTVVGVGGGSSCDTAKYLAWKRGCAMVLVPTIVSVDAPLTPAVGVRVDKTVQYVGYVCPETLLVDHELIQQAPKELNRAGAGDIASIHTALFDWALAGKRDEVPYDEEVAELARQCLRELDAAAEDIRDVTPKGIDTIIDLYRREVEFCERIGTSRPEEGSEHIVAYGMEHLTRRHFIHGDLVALGIFTMSRLQENNHEWAVDLMNRAGLRYTCPGASPEEVRECLSTLGVFNERIGLFYSIVNEKLLTPEFIDGALAALYA